MKGPLGDQTLGEHRTGGGGQGKGDQQRHVVGASQDVGDSVVPKRVPGVRLCGGCQRQPSHRRLANPILKDRSPLLHAPVDKWNGFNAQAFALGEYQGTGGGLAVGGIGKQFLAAYFPALCYKLEGMEVSSAKGRNGPRVAPRLPIQQWMACERGMDSISGWVLIASIAVIPWLPMSPGGGAPTEFLAACYFVGALWVAKVGVRRWLGQFPLRWATPPTIAGHRLSWITWTLAALNLGLLVYVAMAFLNARADYSEDTRSFEYLDNFSWLPASYDRRGTLATLALWGAISCLFWSLRDWLLRVRADEAPFYYPSMESGRGFMPGRVRLLLWSVVANGALLAVVSVLARVGDAAVDGWNPPREAGAIGLGYGPFLDSGLAAGYFNLLWPTSLGFWWILRRERRGNWIARTHSKRDAHLLLLPLTILCAASPVVASDRVGALVAVAMLFGASALLWMSPWANRVARSSILTILVGSIWLGGYLGWDPLKPQLLEFLDNPSVDRPGIHRDSAGMIEDFPMYGVGPGAFRSLHAIYRQEPSQPPRSHMHDDWVEFRVTLGWVGSALLLGILTVVVSRYFTPGGFPAPVDFVALLWMGLAGCLLTAKFHHPLQSPAVLSLLCVYGAILFSGSRPSED